jgi:hypothetical protein
MEQKKQRGGARVGAGAPRKAEVEQSNTIFLNAIKESKNVDNDLEARIEFAKELLTFERGKMFIAEHLFGKPEQIVNTNLTVNDFDIKDVLKYETNK